MRNLEIYRFVVLFLVFPWVSTLTAGSLASGQVYKNGMVVSASRQGSETGIQILRKGGNAVDAAVATGFALAVCYPEAGNLGGGGFMVIRMADGRTEVLDYREKAPLKANRNMYLDTHGNVVDGLSTDTHLASGVPGSVDGLLEAHRKYGKLPLTEVLQPAIDLAEKGYPLTREQAGSINAARENFIKRNPSIPDLAGKALWKEGDILKQPDLAETLKLIRDKGREGFYSDRTASLIIAEMKRGHGLISENDLSNYRSVWRKPLESVHNGYTIITVPPPSGGGITLLQVLKMAEVKGISNTTFHSPAGIHIIVEAERRAFADRSFFAGDADFVNVPVKRLLSQQYLAERMSDFQPLKASLSSEISHGNITGEEPEETTHYSVIDCDGNAVSATTTLNGTFGSCIVVEGAGFLLNNEMDDFSVKPGFPNMYGLTGGEANSISPGKRILSSMTPTIILQGGKVLLVLGSPGGSTIPTTVLQVILNVLDYKMDIGQAVDARRFHHQWIPDLIYIEDDALDAATRSDLEVMGYKFKSRGQIGSVNAIMRTGSGAFEGSADRRGNNVAAGY